MNALLGTQLGSKINLAKDRTVEEHYIRRTEHDHDYQIKSSSRLLPSVESELRAERIGGQSVQCRPKLVKIATFD